MPQKTSPFLEAKYGWALGESNWDSGMNENLVKLSYMFDKNIDGIVSTLPAVVNGAAYFLTGENRVYFGVDGVWYSSPVPVGFQLRLKSNGKIYEFSGTTLTEAASNTELDTRLDAVEVKVNALGTASTKNVDFFATPTSVSAGVTESKAYTDLYKEDLLSSSNLSKGVTLVGGASRVVSSIAELRSITSSINPNVFVLAYIAGGSYGGGQYRVDTSDTSSVDNGGSIIVGASGLRFKLIFRDSLQAGQFGHNGLASGSGLASVQAAIVAMYNAGGGTVTFRGTINLQSADSEILLYPNVKLIGAGLDNSTIQRLGVGKTALRTFRPAGYVPPLVIASGAHGFTINGQSAGTNGNTGLDLSNARNCQFTEINFANCISGIHFNKFAALNDGAFPYGSVFFCMIERCQFASCTFGVRFQGASNRNTFSTNTYSACDTGYDFSQTNNFSETNTFINENIEGCKSWAEWSSSVFSQTWIGICIENPATNGYVCAVKDPGRQVFVNLSLIPLGNPAAILKYNLTAGVTSMVLGSAASSGGNRLGVVIPEELGLYNVQKHYSHTASKVFTGTIAAGQTTSTNIPLATALLDDRVDVYALRSLSGCTMQAFAQNGSVNVVIINSTSASVTISGVEISVILKRVG